MPRLGDFHIHVGSGTVTSETREVRDFDRVVLSGSGALHISQTGEESLTIEAEDNILPLLTSEVHGHTLELGVEPHVSMTPRARITYYLTVKDLRGVTVSGAGKVEVSTLTTDTMRVAISGSGDFEAPALTTGDMEITVSGSGHVTAAPLQAAELRVTISGAGNTTLSGKAARQEVSIPGAGSFNGEELEGEAGRIKVSGVGHATVNVRETLEARISGMGSIRYAGQPQVSRSVSGMGSIRPLKG